MKLPNFDRRTSVEKKIDDFVAEECPKPPVASKYYAEDEHQVEWEHKLDEFDKKVEAYKAKAEVLERLAKAQGSNNPRHVTPDVLLSVGGSITSVLLILNYERLNVIASKAIMFVTKGRV